jgi:tetratricopeptide (TPR) repeat protein
MKRLLFLSVFSAVSMVTIAQNNKVVSAFNYHKYYMERGSKLDDIMNAQQNIDDAIVHEQTMNNAKTWTYRGRIYHSMFDSKDPLLKENKFQNLSETVRSYTRAAELDSKNEYKRELKQRLDVAHAQFINYGIEMDEAGNFPLALKSFEKAIELKAAANVIDTLAISNAALSAEKSKDFQKAINFYKQLIDVKYGGAKTYAYIIQVYKELKDEENAMEFVRKGRKMFPDDKNFIIEEYNYYVAKGQLKEAIANLELAIEKDPTNHILVFSIGSIFDNIANPPKDKTQPSQEEFDKLVNQAEINYKKAIELKADYFDAFYNLGALYFNIAVRINESAQSIKDNNAYNKEIKRADAKFAVALPYLEKAHELDAKDITTINSLRLLYARMGDFEKSNKMKALLSK